MKIVSRKIRASANGQTCTLRTNPRCDHDQTVVTCHLSSNYRGMGLKSPDIFVVHACAYCHADLDSSKVDYKDQMRANQETLMRLVRMGLIEVAA